MASRFRPRHSADAPTDRINSTSVSVSRIRGTLSRVTGCSVSRAAAMIGSAEFLLPEGSMAPLNRCPPSTMYWMGGIGDLAIGIGCNRGGLSQQIGVYPPREGAETSVARPRVSEPGVKVDSA